MKTIGLCMIVRDEAALIRRCLEAAAPLIDAAVILDTGSSDATPAIARAFLADQSLPGAVISEPWQDFAANRSSALAHLRRRSEIDYALMIDADEILNYAPGFDPARFKAALCDDVYALRVFQGDIINLRPQLFRNDLPLRFRGVLHEYLDEPDGLTHALAEGFSSHAVPGSARSRNLRKYCDDAAVLEAVLATETDPFLIARYNFYLARSYHDACQWAKALPVYLRRAELGYWDQEVFISLYYAAHLREALCHPDQEVIGAYLKAYEACPRRAETLHGLMRYCNQRGQYQIAYLAGRSALAIAQPRDGLFVQPWIYQYGLLDEYAIAAYWTGHHLESLAACERLLDEATIPATEHQRILRNAICARDRAAELAGAGSTLVLTG